jgi:unspecific monooxygenase
VNPSGAPEQHIDINDPDFVRNPYPTLERLRDSTPIYWDATWKKVFVTRHEDIAALLRDKRLGRSIFHVLSRDELGFPPPDPRVEDFDHFQANHILDMEPPGHTRIRGLVQKAFTPSRVENLRARIEGIVDDLLNAAVAAGGTFDAVADFAEPLPVLVIAELLGVPEADRRRLRPWSAAIVKLYELGYTESQMHDANTATVEFSAYIKQLADARRLEPKDDLISALVAVEEAGERLSNDELVANCILFLNAGHEATVNGITGALLTMHRHPHVRETLARAAATEANNAPIFKTAVEEFLRFDTPLPMFERWVLEDFDFGGVQLRKGMELALVYASGNRDPRRFSNPDAFLTTRDPNPHLTFGLGTHYCIGAPLARLEMGVALHAFLRRFPKFTLPEQPLEYTGWVIRGLKRLEVQLPA